MSYNELNIRVLGMRIVVFRGGRVHSANATESIVLTRGLGIPARTVYMYYPYYLTL